MGTSQLNTISVIIPAYNAETSIIETIKSVLNQTYKTDYEIIIVDDGSTDNTRDVVKSFINRNSEIDIKLISQSNGGVACARNTGMRHATNEWIAFLDSDDEWLPDKILKQIECIKNNENVDFVGTEKVGHSTSIFGRSKSGVTKISLKEQFIAWYPPTSSYLFRKSILDKIGLMDESFRYGEDDEFLMRILKEFSGWFIAEPLVIYDHGKQGFGISGLSCNLKAMQQGQRRVIQRARDYKILNSIEFCLARIFSEIKYLRRILICRLKSL